MLLELYKASSTSRDALVIVLQNHSPISGWWSTNGINLILAILSLGATIAAGISSWSNWKSTKIMKDQFDQQTKSLIEQEEQKKPLMTLHEIYIYKQFLQNGIPPIPIWFINSVLVSIYNIPGVPLDLVNYSIFVLNTADIVINKDPFKKPIVSGFLYGTGANLDTLLSYDEFCQENQLKIAVFFQAVDRIGRVSKKQSLYNVIEIDNTFQTEKMLIDKITPLKHEDGIKRLNWKIILWCKDNGFNVENVDYWPFTPEEEREAEKVRPKGKPYKLKVQM